MSVTLAITGIKEIDAVLKQMPRDLDDKFMRKVNRDRAKPLVQKIKQNVPKLTHTLEKAVGIVNVRRSQELGTIRVGPRLGRYKGFAGHLVEFGTKKRQTKRGANRGVMPKQPFVEPAFRATEPIIEKGINESIARVLVRTMRRYLK